MTDITAEDYRAAAKVLGTHGSRELGRRAEIVAWCAAQADRMDAEDARDTDKEELARAISAADEETWEKSEQFWRDSYLTYAQRALDHLASRLAPDNGITLTADEAADVRQLWAGVDAWSECGVVAPEIVDRLRARFAPTEQAESQSPTGFDVRCTKRPDPRTARSWPSLDQVPHDVVVTRRGTGQDPAVWCGDRFNSDQTWRWQPTGVPVPNRFYDSTWTAEVSL